MFHSDFGEKVSATFQSNSDILLLNSDSGDQTVNSLKRVAPADFWKPPSLLPLVLPVSSTGWGLNNCRIPSTHVQMFCVLWTSYRESWEIPSSIQASFSWSVTWKAEGFFTMGEKKTLPVIHWIQYHIYPHVGICRSIWDFVDGRNVYCVIHS